MTYRAYTAIVFAAGLATLAATRATPAEAAQCRYSGVTLEGRPLDGVQGRGQSLWLETACDRARRECQRDLERAHGQGQSEPGATCKRVGLDRLAQQDWTAF